MQSAGQVFGTLCDIPSITLTATNFIQLTYWENPCK